MKRFYVFKDGTQQGSMPTKEEAIELIRQKQKRETHPILRSEFSIIEGEEVLFGVVRWFTDCARTWFTVL